MGKPDSFDRVSEGLILIRSRTPLPIKRRIRIYDAPFDRSLARVLLAHVHLAQFELLHLA